jgi:hypothetical protein
MKHMQTGFGIHVPGVKVPTNQKAAKDDGLYLTDIDNGDVSNFLKLKLLILLKKKKHFIPTKFTFSCFPIFPHIFTHTHFSTNLNL